MNDSFWAVFIPSLVSSGIWVGIFQIWFKSKTDKELENHKAKLTLENTRLAQRFSGTFDRMADVMADIYSKIADLHTVSRSYIMYMAGDNEDGQYTKHEELVKAQEDLHFYFKRNKIFIPTTSAKRIQDFIDAEDEMKSNYELLAQMERKNPKGVNTTAQFKIYEAWTARANTTLVALREDFQKNFGIQ